MENVTWFLNILKVAFGLGFVIFLHELGHFLLAKWNGVKVEKFSIGFGRTLLGFRRGETEYVLAAIPLGGFVKITGMSPHEEALTGGRAAGLPQPAAVEAHRRHRRRPGHEPAHRVPARWAIVAFHGVLTNDVVVQQVEARSPAAGKLRPRRQGPLDRRRGGLPAGAQRRRDQRAPEAPAGRHQPPRLPGHPKPGCLAATPAKVVVERDGKPVTLLVTPKYDPAAKRMRIGFADRANEHVGPIHAAGITVQNLWRITRLTTSSIVRIFYDPKARKDVSGVVGSYEATRQSFQFDTVQALSILAIISLSLAVVNLFLFLPLDGGHIFWAVAEKIRGRPIPYRLIERASVVGFMLIAFLFVVGLSNDIDRLRGEGFNVR